MMKKIFLNQWKKAKQKNDNNILNLCNKDHNAKILDLGCDDGTWTLKLGEKVNTKNLFGIEINNIAVEIARNKGINVKKGNLNKKFPFPSNFFDVVHSNQVIEHLDNPDIFLEEIFRVLKPKGYVIISTENISALDNLVSMFLGQQAFSQHISSKWHIGNKLSPHYGNKMGLGSWTHKIIFSYFGIQQLIQKYQFKSIIIKGAGHFPLPLFFDKIDPIHCHFITVRAMK